MVKFHRSEHWQAKPTTLFSIVAAELTAHESQLHAHHIKVELDVDPRIAQTPCSGDCADAIRRVLRLAISRSPSRGEIDISACRTARGIELEIADSSLQAPLAEANAFNSCGPEQLRRVGVTAANVQRGTANWELYCMRCPQGGFAWNIVLHSPLAAVRAA